MVKKQRLEKTAVMADKYLSRNLPELITPSLIIKKQKDFGNMLNEKSDQKLSLMPTNKKKIA